MRRAVFLDRDGVLNRAIVVQNKPYPPANLAEFEVLPGAIEACAELRQAGFLLIVVTNQPDVARGTQRREVVEAINQFAKTATACGYGSRIGASLARDDSYKAAHRHGSTMILV